MRTGTVAMAARPAGQWPAALLLDLDGVVYTDDTPLPGAVSAIAAAAAAGIPVRYITNNAFRTPEQVAQRLQRLGAAATAAQVVTSSVVAVALLTARRAAGAVTPGPVAVVGGPGLIVPLTDAGFDVVPARDQGRRRPMPAALIQGFTPDLVWRDLAGATYLVRAGVWWLATNLDASLPTDNGPAPGNGSLVQAVATVAGRVPDAVAGKPAPAMVLSAAQDAGAAELADVLVVGDRLDTDIAAAVAAGAPAMLVLSGVHGLADAVMATADRRPTFLGASLGDLITSQPAVTVWAPGCARCRDVEVEVRLDDVGAPAITVRPSAGQGLDAARAVLAAAWSALDAVAGPGREAAAGVLAGHPAVVRLDRETRPRVD